MKQTEKLYRVEVLEATVPISDYVKACVDVPKFLGYCKECRNYGSTWACPPFSFNPMEVWRSYSTLNLRCHVLYPTEGARVADLLNGLGQERKKLISYLMEQENSHAGSLMLSVGPCDVCEVCRRTQDDPCSYPELCRHSIESLGGDVGKTAELYFQKPTLWIRDNELPEYLMLVCGLLIK